jgi:glyoxylase-like metal-dependent hydrolase (beta-lactamase superfamily II)
MNILLFLTAAAGLVRTPTKTQVADGVYLFSFPDIDGIAVDGNAIAIINDKDVLVFDANVTASSARAVIAEIRKLTPKPVRNVVNSHWHQDHWTGNEIYAREFPGVEILASAATRRLMDNTFRITRRQLPGYADDARKELELMQRTGKGSDGRPVSDKDRRAIPDDLRAEQAYVAEISQLHPTLPTLTFDNALTLYRGERELRLMHLPGNTAGDTVLYLPKEKVLLTGDLLVAPVPYGHGSHLEQWIAALKQLDALDTVAIVPGHGPLQHDKAYLRQVLRLLEYVVSEVHAAGQKGLSFEETKKAVNLDRLRAEFTHDDPELNADFDGNFGEPILKQAWREATEALRE